MNARRGGNRATQVAGSSTLVVWRPIPISPDFDDAVCLTWDASTRLAQPALDAIVRESPVEPLDVACVRWDEEQPGHLIVSVRTDGDLEEGTSRAARHVRGVLARHDPDGALLRVCGTSETHWVELTGDGLT